MIQPRIRLDSRNVRRAFTRVLRDNPKWTSQELNRQLRASKGGTGRGKGLPVLGMTRRIQRATGVKPQKRIAKRIKFPRSGFANPRKLWADGLALFEALPARYFGVTFPSGVKEIPIAVDPSGRRLVGGAFTATVRAGKKRITGKMRRAESSRLPINWSSYADVSRVMDRERNGVLTDLARFWPKQMTARWRKEFRRFFRA